MTLDSGAEGASARAPARPRRRHTAGRRRGSVPLALRAEDLDHSVLTKLLDTSLDGIVIIDADGRFVYVNPAACQILGYPRDDLLGREYTMLAAPRAAPGVSRRRVRATEPPERALRTVVRPDGEERELEYSTVHFVADGRPLVGGVLRDVTEQRRLERKTAALATIAASLTFGETLERTLDALARSVVQATGSRACTVVLIDAATLDARVVGAHGLPRGYLDAVMGLGRTGYEQSLAAFQSREAIVARDSRLRVLADPRFAAVHDYLRAADWEAVVRVPLVYQDRALGALGVYYPASAKIGTPELDFLAAISSQAAVAIENARLFAEAQEKATLEERQRLARELHDSVSQTLFSAGLIAEVLPNLWRRNQQEGMRRLEELRQLTRGASAEMRMLLLELRPAVLTQVVLPDLLRHLVEATTGRARIPVAARSEGTPRLLPPDVQMALYRIAQEALNNVVKHAHARAATLSIAYGDTRVRLDVWDDGGGFDPVDQGAEHLGLKIMRERAAAIGARLAVHSRPGEGTRIEVAWPAS